MNQNKKNFFAVLAFTIVSLSFSTLIYGANEPDNTQVNQRDQSATEVSAQNQSNSKSDVEITREIRRAVVGQNNFSTYAKNIKIITLDGTVTLKGPVKSASEKMQIEKIAKKFAKASSVVNQIEVKQ